MKQIGIAINSYAAAYNNNLPNAGNGVPTSTNATSRFWFTGYGYCVGGTIMVCPSIAPTFTGGILCFMEGNVKTMAAPLDPAVVNVLGDACSYSIPAQWATLSDGTGNLVLPASFPRGVSQSLACAETCTVGQTADGLVNGVVSITAPAGITAFPTTAYITSQVLLAGIQANTYSTSIPAPASAFSVSGCQAVLMGWLGEEHDHGCQLRDVHQQRCHHGFPGCLQPV